MFLTKKLRKKRRIFSNSCFLINISRIKEKIPHHRPQKISLNPRNQNFLSTCVVKPLRSYKEYGEPRWKGRKNLGWNHRVIKREKERKEKKNKREKSRRMLNVWVEKPWPWTLPFLDLVTIFLDFYTTFCTAKRNTTGWIR